MDGRNEVRRGHVQGRGHRRDALRGGAVALSLGHPRPLEKKHHRDGHGAGNKELEQPEEFWIVNHGVAETEEDMKALIVGAGALHAEPLPFLLPMRQASLSRWCFGEGLRSVKPMTRMTIGEYRTPDGGNMPSVFC